MTILSTLQFMSMKIAMSYLRILREKNGLSQSDIARSIGVEPKQVYRWEKCQSEPSGTSLATFTHLVKGSPDHVIDLILNENATLEDAEILANQITLQTNTEEKKGYLSDSEGVVEAMELVLNLRRSPDRLAQWVRIGKRLVEQ